jgi:mannose-6-phosphate isomerase
MPGKPFALEMRALAAGETLDLPPCWFIPLSGAGSIDGKSWRGSECWLTKSETELRVREKADVLIAGL